ncbi:MAG TPA: hypothetical protein VNE58_00470 [Casimicrobiaceae bacterium]|nr:hypothetical protein [Casimicrobiaceae bacterium]
MKKVLWLAAAMSATVIGGCATYEPGAYYYPGGYYYDGYYSSPWGWGGEGREGRRARGGYSEPGNEAGMFPARPAYPGGSGGGRSEAGNEPGMFTGRGGPGGAGGSGSGGGNEAGSGR